MELGHHSHFPLIDTWRTEYQKVDPETNINYASIGSGGGNLCRIILYIPGLLKLIFRNIIFHLDTLV